MCVCKRMYVSECVMFVFECVRALAYVQVYVEECVIQVSMCVFVCLEYERFCLYVSVR